MIAPAHPLPIQAPDSMAPVPDEVIVAVAVLLVEVVEAAEATGSNDDVEAGDG